MVIPQPRPAKRPNERTRRNRRGTAAKSAHASKRSRKRPGTKRGRRSKRSRKPRQDEFTFRTHGGRRRGAGRKPKGAKAGVPHRSRQAMRRRTPVHVTMKMLSAVPRLRRDKVHDILRRAVWRARDRFDCTIVHYTLQSDHIHLIVEPRDEASLSKAMQGFAVRIARGVNRVFLRKGKVFADRFHSRVLETPADVRAAICYVLNNSRRHAAQRGHRLPPDWVDPMSSGPHFDGWRPAGIDPRRGAVGPSVCAEPKTWLLRVGWRRHGLVGIDEVPGVAR